ncbi:electron transporter RnfB, partial [Burkholderia pseudomallei]
MKILVPVKRVVDYNVTVRVKSDATGVDSANVKMAIKPYDACPGRETCDPNEPDQRA